jgi:predicted phosphodiesterase
MLLSAPNPVAAYSDSYSAEGISCRVDGGIVTAIRKNFVSLRLIQPDGKITVTKPVGNSSSITIKCRNLKPDAVDFSLSGAEISEKGLNYVIFKTNKGADEAIIKVIPEYLNDKKIVFSVVGDPQGRFKTYSQILKLIEKNNSKFVILLGDLVEEGTNGDFQKFMKIMESFPLPFYCIPGNHDVTFGGREFFNLILAPSDYSFRLNGFRFIMLDSSRWFLKEPQWVWLENELKKGGNILVFMHVPPFSPNRSLDDYTLAWKKQKNRFVNLMTKYKVNTVFSGHIHGFQFERRQDVNYYVSGGGGAKPHLFSFQGGYYHYLQVTIEKGKCTVKVMKLYD